MNNENEKIGDRVKRAREGIDINQEKFAECINVSVSTLRNLEGNKFEPKIEHLINISSATRIPITELIFGNNLENAVQNKTEIESELVKLFGEITKLPERDIEIILEVVEGLIINSQTKMRYQREKKTVRA